MKSGIYIVQLLNIVPISSYASDKRSSRQGTPVGRGDIKFGRAKDLLRRQKNYHKTFGKENVDFREIVRTAYFVEIEKAIKSKVSEFRIIGVNNRKLEWLRGIDYETLLNVINETVLHYENGQAEIKIATFKGLNR